MKRNAKWLSMVLMAAICCFSSSICMAQSEGNRQIPQPEVQAEMTPAIVTEPEVEDVKVAGEIPCIGDEIDLLEGQKYYRSSDRAGSGIYGEISIGNPYAKPGKGIVNGLSFLDSNSKIISSVFYKIDDIVAIEPQVPDGTKIIMPHVWTKYRAGWLDQLYMYNEGISEVITSQGIAELVEGYAVGEGKVDIFLDRSGSMTQVFDKATAQVRLINSENIRYFVFADKSRQIQKEDLDKSFTDIGGGTDLIAALNKEVAKDTEHLIIISDLYTPLYTISAFRNLKTIDIIVPSESNYDEIVYQEIKKNMLENGVKVFIASFNNSRT